MGYLLSVPCLEAELLAGRNILGVQGGGSIPGGTLDGGFLVVAILRLVGPQEGWNGDVSVSTTFTVHVLNASEHVRTCPPLLRGL